MAERTIRDKAFRYSVESSDTMEPGKIVLRQRLARRGDKVELREEDIRRGEALGAFVTEDDTVVTATGDETSRESLDAMTDVELVAWLEEEKPSAPQVINAAGDDPELAQRLLDAENSIAGRNARSTVVKGLEKVIEEQSPDEDEDEEEEEA